MRRRDAPCCSYYYYATTYLPTLFLLPVPTTLSRWSSPDGGPQERRPQERCRAPPFWTSVRSTRSLWRACLEVAGCLSGSGRVLRVVLFSSSITRAGARGYLPDGAFLRRALRMECAPSATNALRTPNTPYSEALRRPSRELLRGRGVDRRRRAVVLVVLLLQERDIHRGDHSPPPRSTRQRAEQGHEAGTEGAQLPLSCILLMRCRYHLLRARYAPLKE